MDAHKEIISRKTRNELRGFLGGYTLRQIEKEFDSAYIEPDLEYQPTTSGERRSLVEQYYHKMNWANWNDVHKFLKLYGSIISELERKIENSPDSYEVEHNKESHKMLLHWITNDGFVWANGALHKGGTTIPDMEDVANRINAPELTRQIERIRNSVDVDPSLAIGTAKELLETVCKSILSERNIEVPKNDDMTELVKAVRKSLVLLPEDIDDSAKGSDIIRRLLSNLGTVAQGIAELRNLYGTGHGKHGKAKGISPRHARLAVNASTALATFLYETHWERQ